MVKRNAANRTSGSEKNNSLVASVPSTTVPAEISVKNSFSALREQTSESEMDLNEFEWKDVSDEHDVSDEIQDDLSGDIDNDNVEESIDDGTTTEESEESSASEAEIIINERRYQRVREPWCRDGVPRVITSVVTLLAFAYFMQFVFYMCGFINDDCESPAGLLRYSKARRL